MGRQASDGDAVDQMDWMLRSRDAKAVPPLRREIMAFLRRQASPDADFASAELVIGELLGNAVAHSPAPARVSLCWDGDHPVLSVAVVGRRSGQARLLADPPALPQDPLADGGRGLYIADRLARDLAVRTLRAGSFVSATLNLRRRAEPARAASEGARPA